MRVRTFLYLDDDLTDSFRAQIIGDLPGPTISVRESGATSSNVGAGIRTGPVQFGADRGKSSEAEVVRDYISTPESRFSQLYNEIENDIVRLEGFDSAIWDSIKRTDLVEIVANASIPSAFSTASAATGVRAIVEFANELANSGLVQERLPAEASRQIDAIGSYGQLFESQPVPLLMEALTDSPYRFFAQLDRKFIRAPLPDFDGEVMVLGQVMQVFDRDEEATVFDLTPDLELMNPKNRQQRRAGRRGGAATPQGFSERMTGPVMKVRPIAVY